MLTELTLVLNWIKSTRDIIELNMCGTRRYRTFGTWIGWIAKTFDYINRVTKRFRLAIFKGMKIHSPLSLLCITMILHVHRIFLKILRSPTVASKPGFMRRCYMHE